MTAKDAKKDVEDVDEFGNPLVHYNCATECLKITVTAGRVRIALSRHPLQWIEASPPGIRDIIQMLEAACDAAALLESSTAKKG